MFELLVDPSGAEWRHKVGVAGPVDGSAKPTTRLLAVREWVFKLRLDHVCVSAAAARDVVAASRDRAAHTGVWHPTRLWFVMRVGDGWYPVTSCRELVTLRELTTFAARTRSWTAMLQLSIDVHREHGLGLDLNPANFATDRDGTRLYYVDDELYDQLAPRDLAGAIVARIPEEAASELPQWAAWGEELGAKLVLDPFTWPAIRDEIARYPLPARYEPCRDALVARLVAPVASSPAYHRSDELICVIADVHANAAALDAVLADAAARGATRYLFVGDAVGYGPDPAYCVQRLAELPHAYMIRGNHDHAIAVDRFELGMNRLARVCAAWTRAQLGPAELAWLGELPTEHTEDDWIAVHGAPRDPHRFFAYVYELTYEDNLRHLRERRIPLCFYGHTHVQLTHVELAAGPTKLAGVRTIHLDPRRVWLVNPGSVGQPRDGDSRAAYALWRRSTHELATVRVAYDVDRTIQRLRAADLPPELDLRLRAGT